MAMFRRSKFKHIFGKPLKKEECYDCIRITKSSWDSTFCSVNPKYLAIITEAAGGGAFLVIPLDKVGRQEADIPLVAGHKAAVLDIQFCPHNDDIIASASEDCTIKIWSIPENWLQDKSNLTEPVADLVGHQRRVGLVVWHPTAENVLLSSGADNMVMIWNVSTEEIMVEINFPDMIMSAAFNYNGSRLVTSCKDRVTRIVDPRTGEIITEGKCHEGAKPQQCVYLKDNHVFTTGFSRMSERQYALWNDSDLSRSLCCEEIDTSNGVLFPWYDPDCNLIYLCGKGDSVIRFFEYSPEESSIFYINRLDSSDPQRGIGWMPKRGCDVNKNEIARCFKLHSRNLCEVIPFTVPRKAELYQDDLYPDTAGDTPALTADEWMDGKDADPILVSMKEGFVVKEKARKPIKAGIKSQLDKSRTSTTAPTKSSVVERSTSGAAKSTTEASNNSEKKPTSNRNSTDSTANYSSVSSTNGNDAPTDNNATTNNTHLHNHPIKSTQHNSDLASLSNQIALMNNTIKLLTNRIHQLEERPLCTCKASCNAPAAIDMEQPDNFDLLQLDDSHLVTNSSA